MSRGFESHALRSRSSADQCREPHRHWEWAAARLAGPLGSRQACAARAHRTTGAIVHDENDQDRSTVQGGRSEWPPPVPTGSGQPQGEQPVREEVAPGSQDGRPQDGQPQGARPEQDTVVPRPHDDAELAVPPAAPYQPPRYRPLPQGAPAPAAYPLGSASPVGTYPAGPGPHEGTPWSASAASATSGPPAGGRSRPRWVVPLVVTSAAALGVGLMGLVVGGVALFGGAYGTYGSSFGEGEGEVASQGWYPADADVVEVTGSSAWLGVDDDIQLVAGRCFDVVDLDDEGVGDVELADSCDEGHEGEVYLVAALSGTAYPGDAAIADEAHAACGGAFEAFVGRDWDSSAASYGALAPTEAGWDRDDRVVRCYAYLMTSPRTTGSLEGSGR